MANIKHSTTSEVRTLRDIKRSTENKVWDQRVHRTEIEVQRTENGEHTKKN